MIIREKSKMGEKRILVTENTGEKIYLGTIHKKTRKTRERTTCPLSLKPIVNLWIKRE